MNAAFDVVLEDQMAHVLSLKIFHCAFGAELTQEAFYRRQAINDNFHYNIIFHS